MSESNNDQKLTNEEVVDNITKNLESKVDINAGDKTEKSEEAPEKDPSSYIPPDFEDSDTESAKQETGDDYVDEEKLKDLEASLTDGEKEMRHGEALELKKQGNDEFKAGKHLDSVHTYTKALRICPLSYTEDRSILYANRAASKGLLERRETAIDDCTKAIELNDKYVRAYLRRAKLYEETEKLDESLTDYKKVLEFDPGQKDALQAQYRLPPLINEKNEKLKTEALGKLKELGNMILKPFGLSTANFEMNQDPNSGGYNINFKQNPR